ncbi:hypothetical protein [Microbacterium enclense]|jgi:hypothetical protein|uniref:Uncharacterized protein n=1 Tax=Microbacterium enclense TaxID=993073 RepID=A0A1G6QC66_9MICO|nr:hypothetical protein [Microbacterium enclense]SDC89265.1 hypothetical protein SAMN05216418_3220 [Microbacterium enclense]
MTAPGEDGGKKKFPPGTVVIWIAGAGIGLWLLISGLVGILSGGS